MAKKTEAEAETVTADQERKELLRRAYGTATQVLRNNHRDEFNEEYSKAAKDLGIEWQPRLTDEEKAEQQFNELLAAYPNLAEKINSSESTE